MRGFTVSAVGGMIKTLILLHCSQWTAYKDIRVPALANDFITEDQDELVTVQHTFGLLLVAVGNGIGEFLDWCFVSQVSRRWDVLTHTRLLSGLKLCKNWTMGSPHWRGPKSLLLILHHP